MYTNTKACFRSSKIVLVPNLPSCDLTFYFTSQTYLEYLDQKAATCNYTNYVSTYVTYPPKGLLPLPGDSAEFAYGCDLWDDIFNASLIINPAFNIYRIWDTASNEASSSIQKLTLKRTVSDLVGRSRLPVGFLPRHRTLSPNED